MKFLLASLKTFTNSKSCSGFPLLSLVNFLVYIENRLLKIFQKHRQVLEQLLKAEPAIRKPEQAL